MNKKVLLLEGSDDEHVFKHLCGNNDIHLDEIKNCKGVTILLESLAPRLNFSEEGDVFGFVLDADSDISSRWRSIQDVLSSLSYKNIPEAPLVKGTIIEAIDTSDISMPRVGFWLMPDNQTPGILEDFLQFMVNQPSKLFDHVKTSIENIPEGEQRFSDVAKSKALIHTWLAWQKEPGRPLGTAITARYLDPGVPEVEIIVQWIKNLFFNIS